MWYSIKEMKYYVAESEDIDMGLFIVIGIIWLIYQFAKDASIKQCSDGTDHRKAYNDLMTGKIDGKELNKRLSNGYYIKKDK